MIGGLMFDLRPLDNCHRAMSMMSTIITYAAQHSPARTFSIALIYLLLVIDFDKRKYRNEVIFKCMSENLIRN